MTYYLKLGNDYLILDAHTDIDVTRTGRTTSHPTHRKTSASDNYIIDNPTAKYNGVVSTVRSPSSENELGAGGYIDKMQYFMESQTPIKFKYRLDGVEEDNWFITSFTHSQNNKYGYGGTKQNGEIVQSFEIAVSLERIQPAQGVTIDVRVPTAYSDGLQQKKNATSSTLSIPTDKEVSKLSEKEAFEAQAAEFKKQSVDSYGKFKGVE